MALNPANRPTILIVDDVRANRDTLEELLSYENFRLVFAEDGRTALDLARSALPSLILLDIMMPGMDGYEVCRRLRQDAVLGEVPIILLTSLDDRDSRLRGLQVGADDFISKPFDSTELRTRVRGITRLDRFRRLLGERQRADEAMEHVREQAALIDLSPDVIAVTGADRRIRFWSKGAELVTGWTADEARGEDFLELLGAFADPALEEAFAVTTAGSVWRGEFPILTRDDRRLTLQGRWQKIENGSGLDGNLLLVNSDVTELKEAQARLLRAQRLENIGTLASGIAHDLNNVLAPVLMSADVLEALCPTGPSRDLVNMIQTSAHRGSQIVKQVLHFARGGEGEKVPVQAAYIVKEAAQVLRATLPKSIELQIRANADSGTIHADPTQIHQILLNLAINARDAMPDGGQLKITIGRATVDEVFAGLTPGAKAGPYVAFSVTDTGTGIPAEILPRIFDPLFTTKGVGHGTGLGLATVQTITREHGGFVRCESIPGEGTAFHIYIPSVDVQYTPAEPVAEEEPPRGGGELLLIIDDEPAVSELCQKVLVAHGYSVLCAPDGIEALAIFGRERTEIRAIITDIAMPYMDGVAVAKAIRRLDPTVPILVATGLADEARLAEIDALSWVRRIFKPYTRRALLEAVHACIDAGGVPQ